MPQVISYPTRIEFTPVPSYSRIRRRTFIADQFIDAGARKSGTRIRVRTANGKPHKRTGRNWVVIHCTETPKEIRALVREARGRKTR